MKNWTISALKTNAKAGMKNNYWKAVLVGLLVSIIQIGMLGITGFTSIRETTLRIDPRETQGLRETISGTSQNVIVALTILAVTALITAVIIACVLHVLLLNPLEIGCKRFFHRNLIEHADLKEICYTYDRGYKNGVDVLFYRDIYTILWLMLLVIPGIIKSYEYSMIPYLLSDHPNMTRSEAFARSKAMMKGNKMRAFLLDLSFLLWDVLGILTLGILNIFYITPYRELTKAGLYQALKENPMPVSDQQKKEFL